MIKRYYVMEEAGPYIWQKAKLVTGTYYNEKSWFNKGGYPTLEEAEEAIEAVMSDELFYYLGTYYVITGYEKE